MKADPSICTPGVQIHTDKETATPEYKPSERTWIRANIGRDSLLTFITSDN